MADYFGHWLEMGKSLGENAPKIFNVNWFKLDDDGNFIWPGFGDNMRVLDWIIARCEDKVDAVDTAIGYIPKAEDLNLKGLGISDEVLAELLKVDTALWKDEATGIEEFFAKFGDRLPKELITELDNLKSRLA